MKNRTKKTVIPERQAMTETERELLLRDLTKVAEEYFELADGTHIDITRTESGFSVCVLFDAVRIKKLWRPQD